MASSKKSAMLGLSQWILTDKPKMTDFNADNLRVDNFVKEHLASDLHLNQDLREWLGQPTATGSYAGDGAATRTVTLGFTPKLVVVFAQNYGPIEVDTINSQPQLRFGVGAGGAGSLGLQTTDQGFRVTQTLGNPPAGLTKVCLNQNGVVYQYFAIQ